MADLGKLLFEQFKNGIRPADIFKSGPEMEALKNLIAGMNIQTSGGLANSPTRTPSSFTGEDVSFGKAIADSVATVGGGGNVYGGGTGKDPLLAESETHTELLEKLVENSTKQWQGRTDNWAAIA